MSRQSRSIRSTLVEPFRQIKFGLYMIALSFAFVGILAYLFIDSFKQQYSHVMRIFQVVDPDLQWEVVTDEVFIMNISQLIFAIVAYLIILFWVVFKLTHRYYGPMVSLERLIIELKSGRYHSRVKIRAHDEMQSLALHLNELAESLEKKHGSLVKDDGSAAQRRKADTSSENATQDQNTQKPKE
ncbi:MAG: hypothetical protein AB8C84_03085 [Oligoflexales bacterium]